MIHRARTTWLGLCLSLSTLPTSVVFGQAVAESAVATADDLAPIPAEAERQYPVRVYEGAQQLNMKLEFVHQARVGMEYLYKRQYSTFLKHFDELGQRFPGTALKPISEVLVYQATMLENYSLEYADEFFEASGRAREELEKGLKVPGNEAWEHFMLTGVLGIEAIHNARMEKYLPALKLAFDAIGHVGDVREAAPEFVDIWLADGLYNYWRSALSRRIKFLPDFGDKREQGIEETRKVEREGIFLSAPATLALMFDWLEERDFDKAVEAGVRNQQLYPENVINEMMLGLVKYYQRDWDGAMVSFDRVLEIDPQHRRIHYYRGLIFLRKKQFDEAVGSFEYYLGLPHLQKYQVSATNYRLGQAHKARKEYAKAEEYFRVAIKIDGNERAKNALEVMKKERRDGQIDW